MGTIVLAGVGLSTSSFKSYVSSLVCTFVLLSSCLPICYNSSETYALLVLITVLYNIVPVVFFFLGIEVSSVSDELAVIHDFEAYDNFSPFFSG